jgi:hypothetical protein
VASPSIGLPTGFINQWMKLPVGADISYREAANCTMHNL